MLKMFQKIIWEKIKNEQLPKAIKHNILMFENQYIKKYKHKPMNQEKIFIFENYKYSIEFEINSTTIKRIMI